ncbi:response regulator [Gordoniibacillus kamchatkensis]|uniref:response regulator n=1 Tax=Gordoniibacillus kamchatkensis TaxID=1590651 RepID=UPI0006973A80|nr:response regulator [Paenibacillus sp. VKM B-2647]
MYNVLLVDDEQLDLEVLRRFVPWEQLDMEIAGTAYSGFSALNVLQERHVDILITDIKMPIMTGLELAEQARRLLPPLKIIFISGHDEFQYAQKAITMNASSYILKPVDDRELLNALQLVKEQLDYEQERLKKEAQIEASIPLLRNEMLHQWLKGAIDLSRLDRFYETHGIRWRGGQGCVAIVEIDDRAWKLKQFSGDQKSFAIQHVFRLIGDYIQTHQLGVYCTTEDDKIVIAVNGTASDPAGSMQALVDYVRNHSSMTITVGLGSLVSDPHDMPSSYRQAGDALATKMFMGKCRVITLEQAEGEIAKSTSDLEQIMAAMFAATANYELVRIHDSLEQLFELVHSLKDKLSVYNFALYAVSKIDFFLRSLNASLYDLLSIELNSLNVLYEFETIDDIKSWLRRRLFEVSEHLHVKKKNPSRKLIGEIEQYVAEHLEKTLQLRDVAKVFGFSPNYLGYVFKEATNEAYSDFVTRKRMERARELLKDPKLKIYEAANRVAIKISPYSAGISR